MGAAMTRTDAPSGASTVNIHTADEAVEAARAYAESISGASATDEKYDLSRHWRNARTHASHDPVSWKYHRIGNYLLNDILPPNHGQL